WLQNVSGRKWILTTLTTFAIGYMLLLLPRCTFDRAYDRYLLPLFPCVTIAALLTWQNEERGKWRRVGWAVLVAFGFFAIASTQEVMALTRARVAAADELTKAGATRVQIDDGFEWNYWTQIQEWGYINDKRLVNPPGA